MRQRIGYRKRSRTLVLQWPMVSVTSFITKRLRWLLRRSLRSSEVSQSRPLLFRPLQVCYQLRSERKFSSQPRSHVSSPCLAPRLASSRLIRPCSVRMSSPSHHDPQDDVLAHVLRMLGEIARLRLFLVLARVNDDPNPPDILRRVRHSGFDSGKAAVSMLIQAGLPSCALTKRTNRTLITKGLFRSSGCSA